MFSFSFILTAILSDLKLKATLMPTYIFCIPKLLDDA